MAGPVGEELGDGHMHPEYTFLSLLSLSLV